MFSGSTNERIIVGEISLIAGEWEFSLFLRGHSRQFVILRTANGEEFLEDLKNFFNVFRVESLRELVGKFIRISPGEDEESVVKWWRDV